MSGILHLAADRRSPHPVDGDECRRACARIDDGGSRNAPLGAAPCPKRSSLSGIPR